MTDTSDGFDWDALEADLGTIETPDDVDDATKLSKIEILDRVNAIDQELRDLSEMLHPRTDRGRELHSLRAALRVTLLNRE